MNPQKIINWMSKNPKQILADLEEIVCITGLTEDLIKHELTTSDIFEKLYDKVYKI